MPLDITSDTPLIECILNLSEGRNRVVLSRIVKSIDEMDRVRVLHQDTGYDAHRTVLTIVGAPSAVMSSIEVILSHAIDHIDMRDHNGVHPCIGALDVIPLVPIRYIDHEACQALLLAHAEKWSAKYELPICFYGSMATTHTQRTLAQLRKGGYKDVARRISDGVLKIDLGPSMPHPRLGVSNCTVRDYMVAYNINLDTSSMALAKTIASALRNRRTHHTATQDVRFLAWWMESYQLAQISTNIYDINAITMEELYDYVAQVAQEHGAQCKGVELIGMVPRRGLSRDTSTQHLDAVCQVIGVDSVTPFVKQERILEDALGLLNDL